MQVPRGHLAKVASPSCQLNGPRVVVRPLWRVTYDNGKFRSSCLKGHGKINRIRRVCVNANTASTLVKRDAAPKGPSGNKLQY